MNICQLGVEIYRQFGKSHCYTTTKSTKMHGIMTQQLHRRCLHLIAAFDIRTSDTKKHRKHFWEITPFLALYTTTYTKRSLP
jgi:hypothetical protein